jgi:hypothetical protein
LKASEEIAGKAIRCPQCGNRVTVPAVPVSESIEESPFVVDIASEGEPPTEPTAAPLAFPWLNTSATTSDASAATSSPPTAIFNAQSDFEAATIASFDDLIQPEIEPLRPQQGRAQPRRGTDAALAPPGLREPWYLVWVEGLAKLLCVAAVWLLVIVPATMLIGGLIALVRTGTPRTLLETSIAGVRVFPMLLAIAAATIATAAFWATPFLLVVDLWRRSRNLNVRVDQWLERMPPAQAIVPAPDPAPESIAPTSDV